MEDRKSDHIELAFSSRLEAAQSDHRFIYEPLLGSHKMGEIAPFRFLGHTLRVPIWVSSMTGGTALARTININLARACNEFGMGMGLGSVRILLENEDCFPDFDVRGVIGDDLPLYANIGIAQLEEMVEGNTTHRITEVVNRLHADGLIIHVNPLQEWIQAEGDLLSHPPVETIEKFLSITGLKVIVKEVGQGMGPESIARLMKLPIEAFELAAFGGTNFARVELARSLPGKSEMYAPFSYVGHPAEEMLDVINGLVKSGQPLGCRQIIISGGIRSFLDGYYLTSKSLLPSVYGQASSFLRYATGAYDDLRQYITGQVNGLKFARAFLKIKNER